MTTSTTLILVYAAAVLAAGLTFAVNRRLLGRLADLERRLDDATGRVRSLESRQGGRLDRLSANIREVKAALAQRETVPAAASKTLSIGSVCPAPSPELREKLSEARAALEQTCRPAEEGGARCQ